MADIIRKSKKEKEYCLYTSGITWKNKEDKQYVYLKDDGSYLMTLNDVKDVILDDGSKYPKDLIKRYRINTKKYSLVYIGRMTFKGFKRMKTADFENMLNNPNNYLYELTF